MAEMVIRDEHTGYVKAHVEVFTWDPLTPVVVTLDEYSKVSSLSAADAARLRDALTSALETLDYKGE